MPNNPLIPSPPSPHVARLINRATNGRHITLGFRGVTRVDSRYSLLRAALFSLTLATIVTTGGAAQAATPAPKAAGQPIPESGSFRLWRTPATGVFEPRSNIWLDETSIARGKSATEYWLLRVEPFSNRNTPAGSVAATWFRIAADCSAGKMRSLRSVTVGALGYTVTDTPQPNSPMAAPPREETGFAVALRRACAANAAPDQAPRATFIAHAIIWTRNDAAWDREVAKVAATQPK